MNSVDTVAKFLTVFLIIDSIVCHPCCQINSSKLPRYKLMKSNARLNQFILSRTVVQNVNECKKFALVKKALAFNYGLGTDYYETIDIKDWNTVTEHNKGARTPKKVCEALQCPEVHNFTMLTRDRNYKYYSTYPSSLAPGSSFTLACIPRTGMFIFSHNNLNFSQAQAACQKMNASLAHIISEERTHGLAKYISQNAPTFVGLSNRNGNSVWQNEFDEPLSCFNYRAWGKEEPSHSKGCITLVQPKSGLGPFWKVVPCDSSLPFICEISPMY
ncbi:C-type lectin domain family 6 member A isoform X2 [Megachile rotundata]|uniref:C-type lectin domain family 6 member A isoform X2 n=1 Tax=Megachile rotundata TaxID=143995 RepID=UPI003FD25270